MPAIVDGDVSSFDSNAVWIYLAEMRRMVRPTRTIEPLDDGDRKASKWAVFKDWLAILAAILVPFFLLFLMLTDTVRNGQCTPAQFFKFECNRFDTTFKPWKQGTN